MNKEIKKQWVAALRSGDYKQGRGYLRNDDNEFCCLGVLCNLHAQAHPEFASKQDDPTCYAEHHSLPPREVVEWANLEESDPVVSYKGRLFLISHLNDGAGDRVTPKSFKQIDKVIEEQL